MSHSILPLGADSHALIEFEPHIRERGLPNIALFELSLDSAAEGLRNDAESVFHSGFRIDREDVGVCPDATQAIFDAVNVAND